ncbi:MAG: hypothetical protein K2M07_07300 [Muribaculaceae bacterium]|nr:hypothetical protein [Muribaculaceae bacterium]
MRKNLFVLAFLLTITNLFGQEVKEIVDVIKSSDFEGSGIEDFYIGEAHYTLQYNIRARLDDETNAQSFFFYNPDFLGGLLISTDKSEVTNLEIKWNDSDGLYGSDMWMYVSGSNSPWESIQAVMDAKPESNPQKFRYYAYDSRYDFYGDEPITVVIPEKSCKHYAITPGYIGVTQVKNYLFEFIITRQITVESNKGFAYLSEVDLSDDADYKFVLSTPKGKVLTIDEGVVSHRNVDVTADKEIYESDQLSKFVLSSVNNGKFQLLDSENNKYLGRDNTGKLTLGEIGVNFTLTDGMLKDENDATLIHDGSNYVFQSISRSMVNKNEPVNLYRSSQTNGSAIIQTITDYGQDLPTEYFTTDGIRLSGEPSVPGIYLQRKGGEVKKILFNRRYVH